MAQLLFRQMTVCGVGLIGASLALAAKRAGVVGRVVGLGRGQANLSLALQRGIIDEALTDAASAAKGADLVVLATPLRQMPAVLAAMVPYLPAEAVVSDVGSVKGWVVQELEPLLASRMALVAVHPVAGREQSGAAFADAALFEGHRAIVTPSKRSSPAAIERIEALWQAAGARVERMAPETHDALLALASHLPQIVSSALGAALLEERVEERMAVDYGAGGLRDTTRLAASSVEIWRDICLTNRAAILSALDRYAAMLASFRAAVEHGDSGRLAELFLRGRAMRELLK